MVERLNKQTFDEALERCELFSGYNVAIIVDDLSQEEAIINVLFELMQSGKNRIQRWLMSENGHDGMIVFDNHSVVSVHYLFETTKNLLYYDTLLADSVELCLLCEQHLRDELERGGVTTNDADMFQKTRDKNDAQTVDEFLKEFRIVSSDMTQN